VFDLILLFMRNYKNINNIGVVRFSLYGIDSLKYGDLGVFLASFVSYRGSLESYINNILYHKNYSLYTMWCKFIRYYYNGCYYLHLYDSQGEYMGCFEFYIRSDHNRFVMDDEFVSDFRDEIVSYCKE
jgi:hypothetical protein